MDQRSAGAADEGPALGRKGAREKGVNAWERGPCLPSNLGQEQKKVEIRCSSDPLRRRGQERQGCPTAFQVER